MEANMRMAPSGGGRLVSPVEKRLGDASVVEGGPDGRVGRRMEALSRCKYYQLQSESGGVRQHLKTPQSSLRTAAAATQI